jgi:RNA polymerase sigma factor (sigma-70 family)
MTRDDVRQDAAVALIRMRARWDDLKVAHLPVERQERMAVSWTRHRLLDQYETEFAKQKQTVSLQSVGTGNDNDVGMSQLADYRATVLTDLDRKDIGRIIDRLPERQRLIVRLHLFEGKTQQEVAKELNVTQPAVSAAYERARESLREYLKHYSGSGA